MFVACGLVRICCVSVGSSLLGFVGSNLLHFGWFECFAGRCFLYAAFRLIRISAFREGHFLCSGRVVRVCYVSLVRVCRVSCMCVRCFGSPDYVVWVPSVLRFIWVSLVFHSAIHLPACLIDPPFTSH